MSAASFKLPLIGAGVLLVAGVAAWVVFSGAEDAVPDTVAPLSARAAAPEQPAFKGVVGDGQPGSAEALAPAPALLGPADGAVPAAKPEAGKLAAHAPRETVDLTGRVVDGAGRAVDGARVSFHGEPLVTMFRRSGAGEPATAPVEATTARDGSFKLHAELPEKQPDDFPFPGSGPQLAARHDLFATLLTPLPQLAPGAHDLGELVLEPGAWITGRAVDGSQRAVAGASVTARNDAGGGRERRGPGGMAGLFGGVAESLGAVVTGTDGRFTVRGLHEGKATLTVQRPGLRLAARDGLSLAAHQPTDVGDIVLEEGALIAGAVLGDDGAPIAGADVSVSSMARIMVNRIEDLPRQQIGQEFGQTAKTDAAGRFEVAGLAGGTYTVHVAAPGHAELSREDVPAGTRNLTLSPVRLGTLLVNLVDSADGKPVEHARLKATASIDDASAAMLWRGPGPDLKVLESTEAITAAGLTEPAAGAYLVQDAGLAGTRLVVAADGYATQELEAPAVASGALGRFTVALVHAAVVAGRVLDGDQHPVAGALVQLARDDRPDDGGIVFSKGRVESRRVVRIGEDADGAEELSAQRLTARTGEDGVFELRGASAGDWTLRASADGWVTSARRKLALAEGQSQRDLSIVLDKAARLVGTVSEVDGTPVGDIEVSLAPANKPLETDDGSPEGREVRHMKRMFGGEHGDDERRARTQADGSYAMEGLPAGDYVARLGTQHRGMNVGSAMFISLAGAGAPDDDAPSAPAQLVAGQETRVDFVRPRRASLAGRVLAAGTPVAGVTVTMRKAGGLPFGGERTSTDDRGGFSFSDVDAGSYSISATAPGAALERTQTVKLEAGRETRAELSFSGATLSGQVVDGKTGAGVPGVALTLSAMKDTAPDGTGGGAPRQAFAFAISGGPGGGAPGGMRMTIGNDTSSARTDAQGKFELKYVEPGRYSLEARGSGYMRTTDDSISVAEGEDKSDLHIKVDRGGIVEGHVRSGSTGEALDKVPVRLGVSGGTEEDHEEQMTVTASGGVFRFDGLQPGEYTVEALGSGFGSDAIASRTVKVEANETAPADLTTKG
ncbi:MAG TPA: carboxypeptidase-like regulatory domain-containing protein [Planctomycetota bacterium]|nr:carboxypeptidase-like regulatory domain-containing protein [Planctomycetota bacterium]